ncbi:MAG: prolipoprotein diacylglyceryl transferase [Cytophagales bacterium]|nr:prolipoprotein diacylglyceryl transferase [Armatimonadota bacterium]
MPPLLAENHLVVALYAAGYATGIAAFAWMARRRRLSTTGVWLLSFAALLGGLIGANLGQWIGSGGTAAGKTILGGIAGGYLAVFLAKRALGLRRPTGDLFAVALSAGEAVGRWGCFVGGCCHGKIGAVPWAIFQHGALRHPTQAYLSLAALLTLALLLWLEGRRVLRENGLFYVQGVLVCVLRFVIEFYREGNHTAMGLTTAQWVCLAGATVFGTLLSRLLRDPGARTGREGMVSYAALR